MEHMIQYLFKNKKQEGLNMMMKNMIKYLFKNKKQEEMSFKNKNKLQFKSRKQRESKNNQCQSKNKELLFQNSNFLVENRLNRDIKTITIRKMIIKSNNKILSLNKKKMEMCKLMIRFLNITNKSLEYNYHLQGRKSPSTETKIVHRTSLTRWMLCMNLARREDADLCHSHQYKVK